MRVFDLAAKTNVFLDDTQGTLYAAAFSPDGRQLVAGSSWSGVLLLYELSVQGGKVTVTKKGKSSPTGEEIHFVEYTPDGRKALSVSRQRLRIWDATTWTKSSVVADGGILGGRISPDGQNVVLVREKSPDQIELWAFDDLAKSGLKDGP